MHVNLTSKYYNSIKSAIIIMISEQKSLLDDISTHQEKHKATYSRIEAVIDRLIDLYQQAQKGILTGKNHKTVIQELNTQLVTIKPLKTVRQHFVHYYRKLSNLIRKMQNQNKSYIPTISRYSKKRESGTAVDATNSERFNQYFGKFINRKEQRIALQKMIVQHFLRQGKWQCASVWGDLMRQIDPSRLFNQCFKLKTSISKGDFDEAIAWCESERLYESHKNLLEYQLIKMQILGFVESGDSKTAIQIYTKRIKKFRQNCLPQIQKLMGYIMFKGNKLWGHTIKGMPDLNQFCSKRYGDFIFNQEKCMKLSLLFEKNYFKQYEISQFDTLKIIYECSKKVSNDYQRLMNVMWQSQNKKQDKKSNLQILPFSVKLDKEHQYHSLFLCPVTKQLHTAGESSVMLSCGHLISQTAQERIVQQNKNRRKVKCPVCQKQIKPQDSAVVQF